jgi:hypothetical protein
MRDWGVGLVSVSDFQGIKQVLLKYEKVMLNSSGDSWGRLNREKDLELGLEGRIQGNSNRDMHCQQ